jgi:hypothetical protein
MNEELGNLTLEYLIFQSPVVQLSIPQSLNSLIPQFSVVP